MSITKAEATPVSTTSQKAEAILKERIAQAEKEVKFENKSMVLAIGLILLGVALAALGDPITGTILGVKGSTMAIGIGAGWLIGALWHGHGASQRVFGNKMALKTVEAFGPIIDSVAADLTQNKQTT